MLQYKAVPGGDPKWERDTLQWAQQKSNSKYLKMDRGNMTWLRDPSIQKLCLHRSQDTPSWGLDSSIPVLLSKMECKWSRWFGNKLESQCLANIYISKIELKRMKYRTKWGKVPEVPGFQAPGTGLTKKRNHSATEHKNSILHQCRWIRWTNRFLLSLFPDI